MSDTERDMPELTQDNSTRKESVPDDLSSERLAELPLDVRRYIQSLENLAGHDALTHLGNRRLFNESLLREVAKSLRSNQPLSLIMIDVDNFKTLNDAYGHTAGDEALKEVARAIQVSTRRYDQVFRFGGEEFTVIVNLDTINTIGVAERIRKAVEKNTDLTLSLGIAQLLPPADSAAITDESTLEAMGGELTNKGDQAMFNAKDAGKNKTAFWDSNGKISIIQPKANGLKNNPGK